MKKQRDKGAFTLLELLVVISVIAILATVGLVSYNGTLKKARNSTRKANLHSLHVALEQYYAINGSYPSTSGAWWGEPAGYGSRTTNYIPGLAPQYIKSLPNDPRVNQSYPPCNSSIETGYLYRSDGAEYKLLAHCSPEDDYQGAGVNPYFDPIRPGHAWQVSSGGAINW